MNKKELTESIKFELEQSKVQLMLLRKGVTKEELKTIYVFAQKTRTVLNEANNRCKKKQSIVSINDMIPKELRGSLTGMLAGSNIPKLMKSIVNSKKQETKGLCKLITSKTVNKFTKKKSRKK